MMRRWLLMLMAGAIVLGAVAAGWAGARRPVAMIRIEGAIDVPSAGYLDRALKVAEEDGAECLLILLNTPGGLGGPMKKMTESLLNARVPTIVYVHPSGAFAISAGTLITLAAHLAAMTPATTIGGAHPVELIPIPSGEEGKDSEKVGGKSNKDVMMEKATNAFAEQAKAIAEKRGRNGEWAARAVRESNVIPAEEALKERVINVVAEDVDDLLAQVDGRRVELPGGREVVLRTAGAPVVEVPATAKERFLHVLANPDILLVLLVLAGLGIMFELQHPGALLPGVIGGLALVLALYSMAALPVSYAGVALVVFGMLLLLAEVKVPSYGVLTVGGVTSFVLGAVMLMDTTVSSAVRVSWQVIIVMTVLVVVFFLFVVGAGIRAHRRRVSTGEEGMRNARGRALGPLAPTGEVLVEGERWRARAVEGEIAEGDEIEVVRQDGLRLTVRRRSQEGPEGDDS